jgi:hypothetical protein
VNGTTQSVTTPPPGGGSVINVSCSGTITSALQSAINSASDGDTINISAGTCSGGTVSWTNKNITVQGQGIDVTTVNGLAFNVTDTTKANFRITGMTVGAASAWTINALDRTTGIKGWRIDHIKWSYPTCTQNIAIWINGINWGLIDNNIFNNAGNAIFIRAWAENTNEVNPWPPSGNPGMGGYSWLLPLNLGSDEAMYVEDNVFTMANGCYYGIGDMYYGGRMVFRHNSVTNAYWQNHAARSYERGGNIKAEIYNNDFNATDSAWYRAIHIRSGTGVIFNNTIRGSFNTVQVDNQRSNGQNTSSPFGACNGSSAWDGNVSGQSGWPCLDQIGRSSGSAYPNQSSVPLYAWNNGSSLGCYTGGSCNNSISIVGDGDNHIQSGRDYINNGTSPKPGYTPYTYPHPLRTGEIVPPSPTTYTLTSSSGTGGTITPTGTVTLNSGSSQTFTITPNTGYQVSGVTVNGVNQGAISTYTFSNVTSNGTISATFTQIPVSTTFSVGQRVQTTANLNVRATASAGGTLLGTQSNGNLGTVVSGGASADGYFWWNVNFDSGVDGWVVEEFLIGYTDPTPDTTPPSTPSNLSATAVSTSGINLSWTASTDSVGVTGYRVERCTGSSCSNYSQISTPSGTSYSDTGLSANTTYRYRVRATDAAGNLSSYSSVVNGTTEAPAPIVGDLNNDGLVNSIDLSLLTSRWLENYAPYDLNSDGIVSSLDYVLMVQNWSQ